MKYKKQGMSAIVTMLIIIALALVAIGVVWYVIQNLLSSAEDETNQGASDIFADCVTEGGNVSNETATCLAGEEKRIIGGEYCCMPSA